jgi:cation transport regulator ChaC
MNALSISASQPSDAMPLTFAYGSNMDAQAMAQRCPRGKLLGRARLPRHRVGLMPDGYATLVPDAAAVAHGVLWDVSFAELATLDRYEGVAQGGYVKISQPVLREVGAPVRALIYFGKPGTRLGRAPDDYVEKIVAAAVEAGLPGEHVDFLRRLGGEDIAPPTRFRAIKNPHFL